MKSKLPLLRTVLFSFFTITLLFFLFLPFLCDIYLLPHLIEKLPFSQKEFSLSRISPWKIRGTLRLLQDDILVASIPKFELHYSPLALLRGELDTLLVDGSSIQLHYEKNTIRLASQEPGTPVTEPERTSFTTTLPFAINKIVIRNSHLSIGSKAGKKDLFLNCLIQITSTRENSKYNLTSLTANLDTTGSIDLTSTTRTDFNQENIHITTDITIPNLHDVSQITSINQAILPAGSMDFTAEINLSPETFKVNTYKAQTTIHNVRGAFNGFSLRQTLADSPILIAINGNQERLHYSFTNLSVDSPQRGVDLSTTGTVNLLTQTFNINTDLYSPQLSSPFELSGEGSFEAQTIIADLLLRGDSFAVNQDTTVGPVEFKGNISYENEKLQCRILGNIDEVQLNSHELRAKDINLDFIFQYPQQELQTKHKNTLTIENIHYKNEKVASFRTDFVEREGGINFNTDLISKMNIQTTLHCSGVSHYNGETETECSLPATSIDSSQLPNFISLPENTSFTGIIKAGAAFKISKTIPSGRLNLQLNNGVLKSGETHVTDIETNILLPHLPSMQSAPSQLVTVGAIDSGKIHLENGKIFYRIENENEIFLEKVRLNWCGGKIETGSLALHSKMDSLEVTLYCDRLGFAELLQQFGIEDTEGEGSLNGRLPVSISARGILFDDGFLFSTPGNSGIVRFTNTDQLQQGMPDIGQSATLDYSIKSLENFAYNWTKLTFNTEGDDLLLALQLDGKPAEPLPFGYKNGQIVATEKGPGLQHPIRLDMNFRLPLQELFQYGKSLQSLMENM